MGQRLSSRYTLYSVDVFLHGQSAWLSRGTVLSKEEWCGAVERLLEHEQISSFSVVGYSMGGRFALTLVECFSSRIHQVVLIAPDGIRFSFWHQFASATHLGNYLLRTLVLRPRLLFAAIRIAYVLRLVDRGFLRFARRQTDRRTKRYALYCRWTALRCIKPDLKKIVARCNQVPIVVSIYVGIYDRIIKASSAFPLHNKLKESSLTHLPSNHIELIEATAKHLSNQ